MDTRCEWPEDCCISLTMSALDFPTSPPLDLTVRVGCRLTYEAAQRTLVLVMVKPLLGLRQCVLREQLVFGPGLPAEQIADSHGNLVFRLLLEPGANEIRHDAVVAVPGVPDNHGLSTDPTAVERLPIEVLRYTLPSRYVDSDKLMNFAWQKFGHLPQGVDRVWAICDWVHQQIEYRYGSGSALISASDTLEHGYGVCRDLAHLGAALCRALNLPTRYVSGHLPDIGVHDPGIPMDFHAYIEVYLGGCWHAFDPRNYVPRIGRIKIAHGMDAVDCAFATVYGGAKLTAFEVWAYQVDSAQVQVGDPVDLSKRLDGTPKVRRA